LFVELYVGLRMLPVLHALPLGSSDTRVLWR
jgi:hypothetical protein